MPSSPASNPSGRPVVPTAQSFASTSPATGRGATVTLTGTVEEGVESGCIVLLDDARNLIAQLLGPATSAYPFGSRVQVTGRFVEGLLTTCQQGPPFMVDAVVNA